MRGRIKAVGVILCAVTALASAGTAAAAGPYYAAPAGVGTCAFGSPCSLSTAVGMAASGDTVFMADGTYPMTSSITTFGAVTIRPQVPGTRPVISSTNGSYVSLSDPGAVIRDVRIDVSGLGGSEWALRLQPGTAEGVEVFADGPVSAFAVLATGGGVFSDSVAWAKGASGAGLVTGDSGALVQNSTVVATGSSSTGMFTSPSYAAGTETIAIQNSILIGTSLGMSIYGDSTHLVTAYVDHSNYSPSNSNPPYGMIDNPGGPVPGIPLFVNLTGNFRQAPGSPTINAGTAIPGQSATALDGQARCLGSAPDIGADEFAQPACQGPAPPVTTGNAPAGTAFDLAAAIKKCKKNKKKTPAAKRARKKCIKKARANARA
jgi:hypothetical protein